MEQSPFWQRWQPYGTRRFITMFTRARHWLLSWVRGIKSTNLHLI